MKTHELIENLREADPDGDAEVLIYAGLVRPAYRVSRRDEGQIVIFGPSAPAPDKE